MWAGALAMKASLPSWLFGGGEALFVFGEVFGEALAFGGDVDLAFVDDGYVEVGGAAGVGAGEGLGGELDGADAGHAGEHVLIGVGEGDDAVAARGGGWGRLLFRGRRVLCAGRGRW